MHYTFQHMSIITRLSQDMTQYYKNITSLDRRKCKNTRDIQSKTIQMRAQSLNRKTL